MSTARILALILTVAMTHSLYAEDLKLPSVISKGMVLQRNTVVPIWGWAAPDAKVTVTFAGQAKEAVADKDGKWMVKLDPLQAGGPLEMTVTAGEESLKLSNILVGEVWMCSGQSNMQLELKKSLNGEAETTEANYPNIRLFGARYSPTEEPQKDVKGKWRQCTPKYVGDFSAVGYYFGRDLHHTLNVPIGLIDNSVGGTGAEMWTSKETLMADEQLKAFFAENEKYLAETYPKQVEKYKRDLAVWQGSTQPASQPASDIAASQPAPRKPYEPSRQVPSSLYNGMIAPVVPYAIAGVIWYQGESNVRDAIRYRALFPAMIRDWRSRWGQGDFPFLFVQLPNIGVAPNAPVEQDWSYLREAQLMTLSLPRTAMVVSIDVGDPNDIHPPNKLPVGLRLSLAAQGLVYGKDAVYSGPICQSMEVESGKAVLKFQHVGGGLVARGEKVTGFSIAGDDRKFVWADATIDGDRVIVSSAEVPNPVAVRYAWASNPQCNLYNKEGLPASPFRTDDWPKAPQ